MEGIDWFKMFYTFLGGLGIFFFGMRTLSEALQSLTGGLIRRIINSLTTNRFMALFVGASVTTLVQSSSVTTVMIVGFVNAGLMQLTQAIGVIFGANIGTTITGWIIAVKVGKYGLLMVGLGAFPLMFAKRRRVRNLGRVLMALGFIFMGLEFMSSSFKPLRGAPAFLAALQYFTADNYATLFACVFVGMILTFVIQSSSAMLGITIALALTGSITYQTAVALVLGENIGTTITALLASVGTNTTAKRAARAHAVFNILGVLWLSSIFWIFIDVVDGLIVGDPDLLDAEGNKPNIAAHIAAAHTAFNVANTILFIPLLGHVARLVTWLTPGTTAREVPHLEYLPSTSWSSPAVAIVAAEKELTTLARVVAKTMATTRDFLRADEAKEEVAEEIRRLEGVTDSIQAEITLFICKVQENRLSAQQSADCYAIMRAADELESIADYCEALSRYRWNLQKKEASFSDDAKNDLCGYFDRIVAFYDLVHDAIKARSEHDMRVLRAQVTSLKEEGNRIRRAHRQRIEAGSCSPTSGMFFSDMIVALRKVRSHVVNLAEARNKEEFTD